MRGLASVIGLSGGRVEAASAASTSIASESAATREMRKGRCIVPEGALEDDETVELQLSTSATADATFSGAASAPCDGIVAGIGGGGPGSAKAVAGLSSCEVTLANSAESTLFSRAIDVVGPIDLRASSAITCSAVYSGQGLG